MNIVVNRFGNLARRYYKRGFLGIDIEHVEPIESLDGPDPRIFDIYKINQQVKLNIFDIDLSVDYIPISNT